MLYVLSSILYFVAIPAMVNAYSVKLTLQLSALITFVKFVATGFIVALGVYHLATGKCVCVRVRVHMSTHMCVYAHAYVWICV